MTEKDLTLYKLAKFTNLEITMEGQVQSSGANQARLMEKYKKNKSSIKQQVIAIKIVFAVMLLFISFLPISTYLEAKGALGNPLISPDSVLIPGSILFGAFFIMQLLYLTMLGMFSIAAMMSGEAFRWYETLPISKDKLRKLGFMTVFRNLDIGLITMTLAFPIIMFIISLNIILALIAVFISIINVMFSFSVLVLIAERISRVLKVSEAGSKKATLIRIFTMLSYMIVIFSATFFIQGIITASRDFFYLSASLEIPFLVKILMSLIPYPFAPGYLLTLAIEPTSFSAIFWITTIIGVALSILLTRFIYKRALKAMWIVTSSAALETKQKTTSKKKPEKEIEVLIKTRSPIKAYIRKDLSTTTRDIQTFMFVIMPFILPFLTLIPILTSVSGIGASYYEDYIVIWAFLTMYQPMISMMLTSGFLNMEDTGAAILSSLPINPRDQAKAKLFLLGSIQTISYFLPIFLFIGNPEFLNYLLSFISWYPVVLTLLLSMFQLKIRFFGRMKYKFVVEEVAPEKKVVKWTILIVGLHLIYLAFNFLGGILLTFYGASMMFLVTFIAGLFSFGILLISFNSMFPKVLGKKKMISIRESFKKYPIFGTLILLLLYTGFLLLPILIELPLIFIVDVIPFIALLFIDFFVAFGVMALFWLLIVPRSLDLPEGKQSLKEYVKTIGLKFDNKIVRNILLGIGCSIIFFISTYITANLFGHYIFDLEVIFGTPGSSIAFLGWFFFITMLIPGIWEEVAFRGVITKLNLRRYSQRTTLIIVSVLFGLFHFVNLLVGNDLIVTIIQVIYASLLGFLFGYMFIKTKSLIPSIIAHYLIDSAGQLFMFASFENMGQFILFAVIGIGIIPTFFGMLFIKLVVKEKDERIDLIN
ncbi:MAG: hypothetical protein CEE42_12040 [Promethearchaeota archaeon Loki_b31]|nr:MAG: hypothetical protein CEE42_12040 [Candidatus Lokiarchaeota archaeon Loki_b31]